MGSGHSPLGERARVAKVGSLLGGARAAGAWEGFPDEERGALGAAPAAAAGAEPSAPRWRLPRRRRRAESSAAWGGIRDLFASRERLEAAAVAVIRTRYLQYPGCQLQLIVLSVGGTRDSLVILFLFDY